MKKSKNQKAPQNQNSSKSSADSKSKQSTTKNLQNAPSPASTVTSSNQSEHQQLFGNWTGKTPVVLLNELCQRNKWSKPEYNQLRNIKLGKFCMCILVSKKDEKRPNDDSATKRVTFTPNDSDVWDTEIQAKHYAATFALHRLCSTLNLHNLLAPVFRTYWDTLQSRKKLLPPHEIETLFVSDPFNVVPRNVEKSVPQKEEESKRVSEIAESQFPEYNIPDNLKLVVERVVKESMSALSRETSRTEQSSDDLGEITQKLEKYGFRRAHITEALQYTSSEKDALHWLCIHVPQDDLPQEFISESTKNFVKSHSNFSISEEYMLKRITSFGFSRDVTTKMLQSVGFDEPLAITKLFHRLLDDTATPAPLNQDHSSLLETRTEELEALKAIYDDRVLEATTEKISVSVNGDITVNFYFSKESLYPFEIPGIVICGGLPVYIKLAAMKSVGNYISDQDMGVLGTPMVFAVVDWIEVNLDEIINNPPPLATLSGAVEENTAVEGIESAKTAGEVNDGANQKKKKVVVSLSEEEKVKISRRMVEKFMEKSRTKEYQKSLAKRSNLPSFKFKEQILKALDKNPVIVICGETGCGKSTQIPQFILDFMISQKKGSSCNILVTQPRRISAIALAERISDERCEKIGESTGYVIRGESVKSNETRILFTTTGVILRMLQSTTNTDVEDSQNLFGQLDGVSHVIVDEVHERGVDSDFLLIALRRIVRSKKSPLQVILMSATINSELFSGYFDGAPVLNIPGFTHPVKDFYLEQIIKQTAYQPSLRSVKTKQIDTILDCLTKNMEIPEIDPKKPSAIEPKVLVEWLGDRMTMDQLNETQLRNLMIADSTAGQIDYELIASCVEFICMQKMGEVEELGAVLIFLPGVMEIQKCINILQRKTSMSSTKLQVFPLHSNLTSHEQAKVFRRMPKGVRKVVVATNIAETSITIDDVLYVIDTGRVKELSHNNSLLSLVETFASVAACRQRRGRAGRVRPGMCFKLYSTLTEKYRMSQQPTPEIERVPLEGLVLSALAMGIEDVPEFLSEAISPPDASNVESAFKILVEVGAVDNQSRGITALGTHIAMIPADLRVAKMLLFGAIFKCLDPILTIAGILSSKSPFIAPVDKRDEAKLARSAFSTESSDLLTDVAAFNAWEKASDKGSGGEQEFCEKNFLSLNTLTTIADLKKQFYGNIRDVGFKQSNISLDENSSNMKLVKAVLVAGLYPNIAQIINPQTRFRQTIAGTVEKQAAAKEIRYFSPQHDQVYLHPSSINFSTNKYKKEDTYIIYHSLTATSRVFLRDSTSVSTLPLLLFGGQLVADVVKRTVSIECGGDKRICVNTLPKNVALIDSLRRILDAGLQSKIKEPWLDVVKENDGVRVLLQMIAEE